eukprot:CAMPEP_0113963168 /NCGR_PEP_ID=MMETSP0011_2-20120614/6350_1 /TAXON_ID=101924 /ORGANISM="Rhodosorus marinus" /LENGTH=527 /DNA_ID=CAMNT_0000975161 /DNA_START=302 /DNA_END=1886 /DNA_ORIENTATION=+ /assembly_acc=CAM_ASM_000156
MASDFGSRRFVLGGGREMMDSMKTVEALAPLRKDNGPLFTKISFSGKSFNADAGRAAETALNSLVMRLESRGSAGITEVDLAAITDGQRDDVALDVLMALSKALASSRSIVHIDLGNNSLGENGLMACGKLLSDKPNLRRLYLNNNGLNEDAARFLKQTYRGTLKFEILHFQNNLLESAGAVQLSHILNASTALEELVVSSCRIGRVGAMALGQALRSTKKLVYLDVSDNTFGEEGGETLAVALRDQTKLRVVNLRETSLRDRGISAVVDALEASSAVLEVLDLSANEATSKSCSAIAECVRKSKKLRSLLLDENAIGSRGALAVVQALSPDTHPDLEVVSLAANGISGATAEDICRICMALPKLTRLELDANRIDPKDVQILVNLCGGRLGDMGDNFPRADGEQSSTNTMSDVSSRLDNSKISTTAIVADNSEESRDELLNSARSIKDELLSVKQELSSYSRIKAEEFSSFNNLEQNQRALNKGDLLARCGDHLIPDQCPQNPLSKRRWTPLAPGGAHLLPQSATC